MLVLAGKVHHLRHLGLRDLVRKNPAFPDPVVVDVQHDPGRILTVLVEEPLDDVHHVRVVLELDGRDVQDAGERSIPADVEEKLLADASTLGSGTRVIGVYRERCEAMLAELAASFPASCRWTTPMVSAGWGCRGPKRSASTPKVTPKPTRPRMNMRRCP